MRPWNRNKKLTEDQYNEKICRQVEFELPALAKACKAAVAEGHKGITIQREVFEQDHHLLKTIDKYLSIYNLDLYITTSEEVLS